MTGVTLHFGQCQEPLAPDIDHVGRTNVVTVQSASGATFVDADVDGPLGTAAIGPNPKKFDVNPASDDALPSRAHYELVLATEQTPRYPRIEPNLNGHPGITAAVAALDVGDRLSLEGIPPEFGRPTADSLVMGYTEVIGEHSRSIGFNTARGGILSHVGVLDGDGRACLQTSGAELAAAITAEQASFNVATTSGPRFTTSPPAGAGILVREREVMAVSAISSAGVDTFTRSVANSWGTPDIGPPYTHFGTLANISANGSRGVHMHTVTGNALGSELPISSVEASVLVEVNNSVVPTGASFEYTIRARFVDFNNFVDSRVMLTTSNTVTISVREVVSGVATGTSAVTVPGLFTTGSPLRIHLDASGTLLSANVWNPLAGTEPGGWQRQMTTAHLAAGSVQLVSGLSAGVSNALPIGFGWDNLDVPNPQLFTVVRDAGHRMAHPSGTVKGYRPLRLTL